jgi:hypothetical protein
VTGPILVVGGRHRKGSAIPAVPHLAQLRVVRDEVKSRLSPFESNGLLTMSVEMLIGVGARPLSMGPAAYLPDERP